MLMTINSYWIIVVLHVARAAGRIECSDSSGSCSSRSDKSASLLQLSNNLNRSQTLSVAGRVGVDVKLVRRHRMCRSQAKRLDGFKTAKACAEVAAKDSACSTHIMFPRRKSVLPTLSCRCCRKEVGKPLVKRSRNWDVYRVLKSARPRPTPAPPRPTPSPPAPTPSPPAPTWQQRRRRTSPWPSKDAGECTQKVKQKAMYGEFVFKPPLSQKGSIDMSMSVIWEDWVSGEWRGKKGGVYAAWVFKTAKDGKRGPGGYFGAQLKARSSFIFSVWDGNRFTGSGHSKNVTKSDQLVWPLSTKYCKRNCQDCGLPHLRKFRQAGLTTGTKCMLDYLPMNKKGRFDLRIQRLDASYTINTAEYGGMPKGHKMLGEQDRTVTGSRWKVSAKNAQTGELIEVAELLFEGGSEINRITTFDEMLGCNMCNDAYHRDTRLGPFLKDADGSVRKPISTKRKVNGPSTCKSYSVTGNKTEGSITFQGGPGAKANFAYGKAVPLW